MGQPDGQLAIRVSVWGENLREKRGDAVRGTGRRVRTEC